MEKRPKISVIIPIYGVEAYIKRCALSLFEQTLDGVEYIFVDDCTQDNSIAILKSLIDESPKIQNCSKIICHTENKGLPQARKTGLEQARGKYILHCDSDDWLVPNALEVLYETAEKNDYEMLFFDHYESSDYQDVHICKNIPLNNKEALLSMIISGSGKCHNIWSVLVNSKLYSNDIVYPTFNQSEDWVLMIQLIYYCSKWGHINTPLYHYYNNPVSLLHNPGYNKAIIRTQNSKSNHDIIYLFLNKKGLSSFYKKEIVASKFKTRLFLYKYISLKECRELWNTIYPEIDGHVLCNDLLDNHSKLYYCLVRFHLTWLCKFRF